jgi:hypothetical protein
MFFHAHPDLVLVVIVELGTEFAAVAVHGA